MTMHHTLALLAALTMLALAASVALTDGFDLDWYTVDGGGHMFSTGGDFALGGTVGQPDAGPVAGPMTGGDFALTGGFWAVAGAPPEPVAGDCDGDLDVDLADFAHLADCLGGPGIWVSDVCGCADLDQDLDVDLADLAPFQRAFTGS